MLSSMAIYNKPVALFVVRFLACQENKTSADYNQNWPRNDTYVERDVAHTWRNSEFGAKFRYASVKTHFFFLRIRIKIQAAPGLIVAYSPIFAKGYAIPVVKFIL
jgi:hypothetical protein